MSNIVIPPTKVVSNPEAVVTAKPKVDLAQEDAKIDELVAKPKGELMPANKEGILDLEKSAPEELKSETPSIKDTAKPAEASISGGLKGETAPVISHEISELIHKGSGSPKGLSDLENQIGK